MNGFWRSSGRIFGSFWGHVQLKSRLGSALRAGLRLEVDFLSSTPTILEGFGELLGSVFEIFVVSFVDVNFIMHFDMILR